MLAFASYYQFFRVVHASGFATTDNFHYYVGSKFGAELGYFGLYECTLKSLSQRGLLRLEPDQRGRDLSSMLLVPLAAVAFATLALASHRHA